MNTRAPGYHLRNNGNCCANGHEFTNENTYVFPKSKKRHCRTCKRNTWRHYSSQFARGRRKAAR